MKEIIASRKADFKPGSPTPGLTREIALENGGTVIIHTTTEGGVESAWHHHGKYETYGYLISGALRFEYGPEGKKSANINSGEYFYLPAGAIHRDVNPSKDIGQEAIIMRTGGGPMTVNADGPES